MASLTLPVSRSITLILISSLFQFVSADSTVTSVLHSCRNTSTYTQNDGFHDNLNLLLNTLSSKASITSFYNSTAGVGIDKAFGLFLCLGDVSQQVCYTCVEYAALLITEQCPNQKEAIIYCEECILRYANRYIFSSLEEYPSVHWESMDNLSNYVQFAQLSSNAMGGLITKAAFSSSSPSSATGEANVSSFQKLSCFVQCTPDINSSECKNCLQTGFSALQNCCYGREWARYYAPSCLLRYDIIFSEGAEAPSPLPLLSSPTANSTVNSGNKSKTSSSTTTLITTIVMATLWLNLIIFICTYLAIKKVRTRRRTIGNADLIPPVESLQYDFGTIRDATCNFSEANKLGEGGFGPVFKGMLNRQEIAVKKLSGNSKQGEQEFKNEVLLLAKLQHRNLVRLLGFSLEGKERLLIYEFLPNKSLDHFIFDPLKRAYLDWTKHKSIIVGIARGLLYLHEDSHSRIIHRDLKPGNILLDSEMSPKISDFGTARLILVDQTHCTTSTIKGTFGYLAPEYSTRGHFSVKSDVFSFGVLLLEIISGQKISCFLDGEDGENLLSYAWKCWKKNTAIKIVDQALTGGPRSEILRCIHIGLLCVQEIAADRPSMDLVVNMLTGPAFTLSMPSEPAYLVPERVDRGILLQEVDSSVVELENSESKSAKWSINDVSITEPYVR